MAHNNSTRSPEDRVPGSAFRPERTGGMVRGVLLSAGMAGAVTVLCSIWLMFDLDPGREQQLITVGMVAAAGILACGILAAGFALALLMVRDARRAERAAAGPAGVVGQGS